MILSTLFSCSGPEGRSWIIPLTIDDSMLDYTPGLAESYAARRTAVLENMEPGYLLLRAADQDSHNRHEFRTSNNFFYLCGYEAHNAWLLLEKGDSSTFTLSMPPYNLRREIYDGGELKAHEVKEIFMADRVLEYGEMEKELEKVLSSGKTLYADLDNLFLKLQLKAQFGENVLDQVKPASEILGPLRTIKDKQEVERLQKACNITARSLVRVMTECEPGMMEYQMEALIEGTYLEYGSHMPGFNSIVASGPNSTTLHYEPNDRMMEDGDLLLMDIGADYGYYTADISRTIPVNGKFSPEQKDIYQLVLDAQKASIAKLLAGNGIRDGHIAGREIMTRGLYHLGLITDTTESWQIEFYCVHGTSHYLGLDVHDVGAYHDESDEDTRLEPGMVLTVEPGIYFREQGLEQVYGMHGHEADSSAIDAFIEAVRPVYKDYVNIGVRIEDDVLITKTGNVVLSRYAPKEVEDIEQLMR